MNKEIEDIVNNIPDIPNLSELRNIERKRYIRCFIDYVDGCDGNWGETAGAYDILKSYGIDTICDIGCGIGNFIYGAVERGIVSKAYGIDPASIAIHKLLEHDIIKKCPGAIANGNLQLHDCVEYIEGDASYINLDDNSVDAVTSFDCLEHVLPEDIDTSLKEMIRVSKKYLILSIGISSSKFYEGKHNHPSLYKGNWWQDKLSQYCAEVHLMPYNRDGKTITLLCKI